MDSDDVKKFLVCWLLPSTILVVIVGDPTYFLVSYSDLPILRMIAIGWLSLPPIPFFVCFFSSELDEEMRVWFTVIATLFVVTVFASFLPSIVSSYILMPPSLVADVLSIFGASLAVCIALPLAYLGFSSFCEHKRFVGLLHDWIVSSGILIIVSLLLLFFPLLLPVYLSPSEANLVLCSSLVITVGWLAIPPTFGYLVLPSANRYRERRRKARVEEAERVVAIFERRKGVIRIPVKVSGDLYQVEAKLVYKYYYNADSKKHVKQASHEGTDHQVYVSVSLSSPSFLSRTAEVAVKDSRSLADRAKDFVSAMLAERKTASEEREYKRRKEAEAKKKLGQEGVMTENDRKRNKKGSSTQIIKAGENLTAVMNFEKFLSSWIRSGEVLLCDSYVSMETLIPFNATLKGRKMKSLKILTSRIVGDADRFSAYKKKMEKEIGVPVEVRTNPKIHDRYLINGKRCWSIGTSINELGNKDTVLQVNREVDSMKALFQERWNEGTSL